MLGLLRLFEPLNDIGVGLCIFQLRVDQSYQSHVQIFEASQVVGVVDYIRENVTFESLSSLVSHAKQHLIDLYQLLHTI